jgi:two-component sensor histidine kinase
MLDQKAGARWLRLHWREKGGPPVTPPTRRGFGSRVIEQGLAHELDGKVELDYQPGGIVCTIDVPAPQAVLNE